MGLFVTDFIRPVSLQDKYPTHLDIYGQGGIHSVDTIAIRNTISKARRKEGMLSFVKEDNSYYALLGGVENANWVKIAYFYDNIFNFVLPLKHGYILIGDKNGLAKPSPLLIDIRQDIVDLRRKISNFDELNKLDYNRIWIGNYYNEPIPQLHIGIINLPPLAEAVFPNPISSITGDFRIPNPTFDYLSPFDWVMSGPFLPQIFATKYDTLGNPTGTDVSSSLAMTQVRAAQIMKRFDNANFIVGSSTVTFAWENPKMLLMPESLKQLYGLGTTYTFTKAQSLGALETGLLKNTVNNASGTLSKAIAGKDYIDLAPPIADMKLALIRPVAQDGEGNDIAKLIARVDRLPEDNMPDLTFIMQRPSSKIPSAQGLSDLAPGGILKSSPFGVVSIASGGKLPIVNDYVDPLSLQKEIEATITECNAFATAEAAAAEAAAIAAGIAYFTEQMLPFSLIPLVPVGASITAAIAAAVLPKEDKSSHDADITTINNRIDNLNVNLIGDVLGTGLLSSPVVTVFTPNPRFTGKSYMKIPTGTILERPSTSEVGMIRYNTEI